jgi:hypothetical protein
MCFNVLFGTLELPSPYLWKKGQSAKPLRDVMGLTHHGRSEAVMRALSDFGSEDSFGHAAERFTEHYHYTLSSTTAKRVTKQVAQEAQGYVDARLRQATMPEAGEVAPSQRVPDLLLELDGCLVRTATLEPSEDVKDDGALVRCKKVVWQETRIGLARRLDETTKTYVGKHALYPEVVDDLVQAAVLEGMSPETAVTVVADGAHGLREALDARIPNLLFILDQKHLKDHLYATAEELGLPTEERAAWVQPRLDAIKGGQIQPVMEALRALNIASPHPRIAQLLGYLTRFADAVDYESFQSYGYPIGSGEVESAHKSVPQKRLKIPGACWHPDSVNPMVALRVLRANGWWEDFWMERQQSMLGSIKDSLAKNYDEYGANIRHVANC